MGKIPQLLHENHLTVLGGFYPDPKEELGKTLLLIGPAAGFWDNFQKSTEASDHAPNPLDRWSERVISGIADTVGARAYFPFGGPPYRPFIDWALRTGRVWQSPATLLIHREQGLWASFRGALSLDVEYKIPDAADRPCDTCVEKPCLTACPANALTIDDYDIPACRSYLSTGAECMSKGCLVRAACPISKNFDRSPQQSAFHMQAFL